MPDNPHNLSSLQQSVLAKYESLAAVLHELDSSVRELNRASSQLQEGQRQNASVARAEDVLQEMREIETKMGLIGTLLKGSVYSFIVQRKNEYATSHLQQNRESRDVKQVEETQFQ